ncbi:threonine-phosphate decarboxylase [Chelatococcus daeguensis]|nr:MULTISPECIES: threonine-phosphate decarboxylase CobD [Chelatococcus]KZE28416.1 threonine-phosphate decarboxylase [Chelatococcus daeguensis]MBM3083368.1 threonine-phosphate decarboxylase [Chelatococcus daeguensis]
MTEHADSMAQPGSRDGIVHGGDLGVARRLFPAAPQPWLDLSTGINPHPFPLPSLAADCWTRLPEEGERRQLEAKAVAAYGVAPQARCVAAPGTQALIQLLPRLRPRGRVAVLGPTYGEHVTAWQAAGHDVRVTASVDDLAASDVAVIVNPNNPDGHTLPPAAIVALAGRMRHWDGLVIVDEAFADVMPQVSCAGLLDAAAPILLLRSFGKAYGLAGVRLGFAITVDEALAGQIRQELGPWAVPGPTLAVGLAALGDRVWIEAMRHRLASDAARLDTLLAGPELAVVGGTPLFRLVETSRAGALFEHLGARGIYVRRFDQAPNRLRFGLPGDEAAWTRLATALAQFPQRRASKRA